MLEKSFDRDPFVPAVANGFAGGADRNEAAGRMAETQGMADADRISQADISGTAVLQGECECL